MVQCATVVTAAGRGLSVARTPGHRGARATGRRGGARGRPQHPTRLLPRRLGLLAQPQLGAGLCKRSTRRRWLPTYGQEWRPLHLPGSYLQYFHCARVLGRGFMSAADGRSRAQRGERPRSCRLLRRAGAAVCMGDPVRRAPRRSVVLCLPPRRRPGGRRHARRTAGARRSFRRGQGSPNTTSHAAVGGSANYAEPARAEQSTSSCWCLGCSRRGRPCGRQATMAP